MHVFLFFQVLYGHRDRSYGRGRDLSGTEYQVCDDDDDYLNIVPMILGTTRRTSGSGSGEMLS